MQIDETNRYNKNNDFGVTIVELLVVIFVIGLFIAFFAPVALNRASNRARVTATQKELLEIRNAICGDPELISNGEYAGGFKNDVGRFPIHLVELVKRKPDTLGLDTLPLWNPWTKHGWNGPYIRDDGKGGYLYDAWGEPYIFIIDASNDTLGLKSPGPDGTWYVPGLLNDDIQVLF